MNASPTYFFGPAYHLTSGVLALANSSSTAATIGTFTISNSSGNALLDMAEGAVLKPGDVVTVVSTTTYPATLPAGDYFILTKVSGTTFTVSTTNGGTAIAYAAIPGGATMSLDATIPLLAETTDTEAHPTTGDWRKVVFGLMEGLLYRFGLLPSADIPTKVSIRRNTRETSTERICTYTVTIRTNITGVEVADE